MIVRQSRAERAAYPLARDSIRKIAESVGGCLRPVQLRRTDTLTGQVDHVMVPCGATLSSICPPCAERAKALRVVQCREGWHLEDEPDLTPPPPDETQEYWLTLRADAQAFRDRAWLAGEDTAELDELIAELDSRSPVLGSAAPSPPRPAATETGSRRSAGPARRAAARTLPRCRAARSPPAQSARCTSRRMAGLTGHPCSSP